MGSSVMAFVLDNSVLIGWIIPSQASPYTRQCKLRAQREAVFVPALWEAEFTNVLLVLVIRKLLPRHQAVMAFSHVERLPLTVDREPVSPRRLFQLGERNGVSAHDAAYFELAERRGLPLATRDKLLARAARAAGMLLA